MILDGVAMVITRDNDANMAVQTKPDNRESNSETRIERITWYSSQRYKDQLEVKIGIELKQTIGRNRGHAQSC